MLASDVTEAPPIKYMSQFGLDLLDWRVNRNFIDHLQMSPGFAVISYWQTNADSTSGVCQAKYYPIVVLDVFSNTDIDFGQKDV